MELALSLGDSSKPFPSLLNKTRRKLAGNMMDLGFCMGLGSSTCSSNNNEEDIEEEDMMRDPQDEEEEERRASSDPPLQLDLLPSSPVVVPRHHQPPPPPHQMMMKLQWLTPSPSLVSNKPNSCSDGVGRSYEVMSRLLKRKPMAVVEEAEDGGDQSSPNSTSSSFQHLDFSIYRKCFGGSSSKRPWGENHNKDTTRRRIGSSMNVEGDTEATKGGGGSDDEDSGLTRKKLRLSKEQSAFLEESFKEHNTLTPKQKIALAKELNLRPRQVEVWFQNRRARTKLKQTEVDCEYLKRCCETLTEENRRLQKELQELRALKTSQPFFMQLPATTLTMCPSCERVTSTTTTAASTCKQHPTATTPTTTTTTSPTTTTNSTAGGATLALAPPNNINSSSSSSRLFPFIAAAHAQANVHQARGHPTAS